MSSTEGDKNMEKADKTKKSNAYEKCCDRSSFRIRDILKMMKEMKNSFKNGSGCETMMQSMRSINFETKTTK